MNIETAKVQFTTAHQLQDAGRLAEARALYGSVVTSGHLIELALHNLGVIAEAEGDGERAKVFFASALALARRSSSSRSRRRSFFRSRFRAALAFLLAMRCSSCRASRASRAAWSRKTARFGD